MDNIVETLKVVIPIGKCNAIHQRELADKLGIKSTKTKKCVQIARRKGLKICSGQAGYWIAENDEELKAYSKSTSKGAITRLKTTKPIRDALKEYKGQMSLADTSNDAFEEGKDG